MRGFLRSPVVPVIRGWVTGPVSARHDFIFHLAGPTSATSDDACSSSLYFTSNIIHNIIII